MKIQSIMSLVVLAGAFLCQVANGSVLATYYIVLNGEASGGTLTLVEMLNRNPRYVTIKTKAGESAESVAERLAWAVNESNPFGWWGPKIRHLTGPPYLRAQGGRLGKFPGAHGMHIFGGTEKGLGIPRPPLFLSCSYDPDTDVIALNWLNPPEGYDGIAFIRNGLGGRGKPGTLTSHAFDV